MPRRVLLLRGVNVGGANPIAMADLRALLEDLGYADARTHLQSGNAVVTTGDAPEAVAAAARAALAERAGLSVRVVVRTGEELAAIVAADRLGDVADDPARRVVVFLSEPPPGSALDELRGRDFGEERWEAEGREVHAWCPGGLGRSPVLAAVYAALPEGTARNWRTVTRLAEMAAG